MFAAWMLLGVLSISVQQAKGEFGGLYPKLPISAALSSNSICSGESRLYEEALGNVTFWAAKMWDSSTKAVEGVLVGNMYQTGNFEECMEVEAPFPTRYCLATIKAHPSDSRGNFNDRSVLGRFYEHQDSSRQQKNFVKVALCIPASCSSSDLEESLNRYLEKPDTAVSAVDSEFSASVSAEECQSQGKSRFDRVDLAFCVLTACLLICAMSATAYDFTTTQPKQTGRFDQIIMCFSLRRHVKELFRAEEENEFSVLRGTRVVSCMVVVGLHRYLLTIAAPLKNLDALENSFGSRAPWRWLQYQAHIIVETFFVVSGILAGNKICQKYERKQGSFWKLFLHRYLRLTPLYAYVILFNATLWNFTGSGPLWKATIAPQVKGCRETWYLNLLYIHNYVKDGEWCVLQSWTLSADLQFYVLGLLISILIVRKRSVGLFVLFFTAVASIVVNFVVVAAFKRKALFLLYPTFLYDSERYITYNKSYLRAATYLIGFYGGYLIYEQAGKVPRLGRAGSVVVLTISTSFLLLDLGYSSVFYDSSRPYNQYESAAYAALSKPLWALATLGVNYVAAFGSLSVVRDFFTSKFWVPFSKLTYSAFLIHWQYQIRTIAVATSPHDLDHFNLFVWTMGDYAVVSVLAFLLHVLVEAPIENLSKVFLRPEKHSKQP